MTLPCARGGLAAIDTVRDLRRAQIIGAARQLIAEAGLEGLTIAALEARCGFSRGVITYHFDDKSEIVEAVLDSVTREIGEATEARLGEEGSHAERLRIALRSTVEGYLSRVEAGHILLSFWGRLRSDPHVGRINAGLYARYRKQVGALISEGIAAGDFAKVDVPSMAALMVGVVLGLVTQFYFEPKSIDPWAAVELAADGMLARLEPKKRPRRRKRS